MKYLILIIIACFGCLSHWANAQHVFALDDDFDASDPNSAAVTAENLLEREQFWPYHTALTQNWLPADGTAGQLAAGLSGILLRIKENGTDALVDFGRNGLHAIPVSYLDVVVRAEAIRAGTGEKRAENLVLRIGGRLVDGAAASLRPFIYDHEKNYQLWMVLFAAPGSVEFQEMHAFFAEYTPQDASVFPMLFPLGAKEDAEVLSILQEKEWGIPFVYHFLAPSYLRSMQPENVKGPAVVLFSPEGRLILAKEWSPSAGYEVIRELEARVNRGD